MFRLSKFIDDRFVWSIENLAMDAFADQLASVMEDMSRDSTVSLRVERA